jgi:hypothetical protein
MTVSLPFQQSFTYRKLGYLFFQDSLAYRTVLEQNPQWRMNKLPPIGAQLKITGNGGASNGLSISPFIFGLPTGNESDAIFPFDTEREYVASLNRYTFKGVVNRANLNGITMDSTQAITGKQAG